MTSVSLADTQSSPERKCRRRGTFVCFEGIDRSGSKSTQLSMLANQLRDNLVPTKTVSFPDRSTAVGRVIDSYLKCETELDARAAHLLFSANRHELMDNIRELIYNGTTVIIDRYAYSSVAFSVANGLDKYWCMQADKDLPKPDAVFFIDITLERDNQQKVIAAYRELAKENVEWVVFDATTATTATAHELHQQIFRAFTSIQEKCKQTLDTLW